MPIHSILCHSDSPISSLAGMPSAIGVHELASQWRIVFLIARYCLVRDHEAQRSKIATLSTFFSNILVNYP
jgi:hypothetical protein